MGAFYSRILGVRRGRNAVGHSDNRSFAINGDAIEHRTNGACVADDMRLCSLNCPIRKLSDDLILR